MLRVEYGPHIYLPGRDTVLHRDNIRRVEFIRAKYTRIWSALVILRETEGGEAVEFETEHTEDVAALRAAFGAQPAGEEGG